MKMIQSMIAGATAVALTLFAIATPQEALQAAALVNTNIPCTSAILISQTSGKVLFEKDADLQTSPASITKVMVLLLVMEALEDGKITLEDSVTCSPHAASMGGSQIWLSPGEKMTVHELLKAAATASANDAAVALGEHLAGSEEGFVALMNQRAEQLGMKNTVFKNATGLDLEGHVSTARDIALMSAELLTHPQIIGYTTIWMDELRNGETQLVNTNKLIRFYKGATGLKTGTTDDAGACLSASATRNGLSLVAVVLGAKTSDLRFDAARGLLDYGFANFEVTPTPMPDPPLSPILVKGGVLQSVGVVSQSPDTVLIEKSAGGKITQKQQMVDFLQAPVLSGDRVGHITVLRDGVVLCEYEVVAAQDVDKMTFSAAFNMIFSQLLEMGTK